MKRPGTADREGPPERPISLVCVSPHKRPGPQAKDPDKLTSVRGKWAWCPSGARAGHVWKPVAAGSLNALRVQLVEVSRLVDLALNTSRVTKGTTRVANKARQATHMPKSRTRRR